MKNGLIVLIELSLYILIYVVLKLIQNRITVIKSIHISKKVSQYIQKINTSKKSRNKTILVLVVVLLLYCFTVVIVFSITKVFLASLIFSIPILLCPYIFIEIRKVKRKKDIVNELQVYSLNLKNNIKNDNNIILAIKRAKVEGVLKEYFNQFIKEIDNGINIYEAFARLDYSVAVPEFSELIQTISLCYKTGGEFAKILETYSKQISDRIIKREKEREKSISTVITLAVMIVLNVFMLLVYVPQNPEFLMAFNSNFLGRFLIDINALTTMLCLYFLYKIYKMEE